MARNKGSIASQLARQRIFNEEMIRLGAFVRDKDGRLTANPKCGYAEAISARSSAEAAVKRWRA